MSNNIRIKAKYQTTDNKWYLDIVPPVYLNGNLVVQEGTLYFKQAFNSKEDAYELAKAYLASMGISQEIIDNKIDYE